MWVDKVSQGVYDHLGILHIQILMKNVSLQESYCKEKLGTRMKK